MSRISFFYKFFLILFFTSIVSCSKNFKDNQVILLFPKNIAKIEGDFALFFKKDSFQVKQNISSDDCESWAMNLELENLFLNSYLELSSKMFQNVKIIEDEYKKDFLKEKLYKSIIILEKNIAYVDFITESNKGKFKITLDSTFRVNGDKKEVNNNLNSKQTWEKNIYLNCNLAEGAKKATEEAFKNLIHQAHSNIYEAVFTVTR